LHLSYALATLFANSLPPRIYIVSSAQSESCSEIPQGFISLYYPRGLRGDDLGAGPLFQKLIFWVKGVPDPSPLNPSLGEGGMDAFHGPGWYFTDIPPGTLPRGQIAPLLWDGAGFKLHRKTEYWLLYRIHVKAVTFCKRHVYLVCANSRAQITLIKYGKTPDKQQA
jgi:hypothetical protein